MYDSCGHLLYLLVLTSYNIVIDGYLSEIIHSILYGVLLVLQIGKGLWLCRYRFSNRATGTQLCRGCENTSGLWPEIGIKWSKIPRCFPPYRAWERWGHKAFLKMLEPGTIDLTSRWTYHGSHGCRVHGRNRLVFTDVDQASSRENSTVGHGYFSQRCYGNPLESSKML